MVGSGLRVDESINLHWEDIQFKDRNKNVKNVDSGLTYSDDERYYLKLNVRIELYSSSVYVRQQLRADHGLDTGLAFLPLPTCGEFEYI